MEENLKETVKYCLKWNEYKFLTRDVLHDLLLGGPAVVRPAVGCVYKYICNIYNIYYIYIYIYIYQNTVKGKINQVYQFKKRSLGAL